MYCRANYGVKEYDKVLIIEGKHCATMHIEHSEQSKTVISD